MNDLTLSPMNKKRGRPANVDPLVAATVVARLRKLVKEFGVSETARRLGLSKALVSYVKNGHRHKNLGAISLNSLDLRKSDKLCRKCGEVSVIATKSMLCVCCEIFELAKLGLVELSGGSSSGDSDGKETKEKVQQ